MSVENETPTCPLTAIDWTLVQQSTESNWELRADFCQSLLECYYTNSRGDLSYLTPTERQQVVELMDGWMYETCKGTLPTRFKNAWYKVTRRDPSNNTRDILARGIELSRPANYYANLSPVLHYEEGKYGDPLGTCYWTYHKAARAILTLAGGHVLLLRKINDDGSMGHGVGRSWVHPVGEENVALRNAYGISSDKQTFVLKQLLDAAEANVIPRDIQVRIGIDDERYQNAYLNIGSSRFIQLDGKSEPPRRVELGDELCHCLLHWHHGLAGGKQCEHCPFKNMSGRAAPGLFETQRDRIESPGFETFSYEDDAYGDDDDE